MKSSQIAKIAAVLLVSGGALAPASSAPGSVLRPLSGADMEKTKETGCAFSFDVGRNTLVQGIGHDFTMRTAAGLKVCRINDDTFQKLGDGASTACGGYTLKFRRLGSVKSYQASDSAGWPSSLTISQGRRIIQTIRGNAGTAC